MISTRKDFFYQLIANTARGLAVLVDPDDFEVSETDSFLKSIPPTTNLLLVGGSTANAEDTKNTVIHLKSLSDLPVVLFPGSHHQLCHAADAVLFLSLVSGRNPTYLIDEQINAVPFLETSNLEVIPTGYLLIDGGKNSSVEQISKTQAINSTDVEKIVQTAKACFYMGKKIIYLEAGSGATRPVPTNVISAVAEKVPLPIIVGGGIRSKAQQSEAYQAGAHWVVMGTAFEKKQTSN